MNSPTARLRRLIDHRDDYTGRSNAERRARRRAALEAWAALPRQRDRNRFRAEVGA